MSQDAEAAAEVRRYSAFLSYSHADEPFARALHRKLEAYRLPGHAVRQASASALRGDRLKPLFRDIDELSAAADLSAAVREAMVEADHLIVVCSPNAAQSPWVAREVALFRELHGPAGIIAALAAGEPAEAFPPALMGGGIEPLAADFRGDGTEKRLALLKLIAVLAGVRLDELIQRDAQRRMRGLAYAAAASVAGIALVTGLSLAALESQRDAAAQRARAGGLSEFMLSDLRSGLEAAGRHDLLAKVDAATLKALNTDISRLTPDQLIERAKALQAAGEDAEKKGDLKTAHAEFDAALKTTTALLAASPGDPKRIFAHAQSEYWIGFVNWREGNGVGARTGFEAYQRLANRLTEINPGNDAWRMETVYAANNLGTLALRQAGDAERAEAFFQTALAQLGRILQHAPNDAAALKDEENALAWLADCQRINGKLESAAATRKAQRSILDRELAANPRNVEVRRRLLSYELGVARIAAEQGKTHRAIRELEAGRREALALNSEDPTNKDLAMQARMFELFEVHTWLAASSRERPAEGVLTAAIGDCRPIGAGAARQELIDFCRVLLARLRAEQGDEAGARAALMTVRQHSLTEHDVLTARWGLNFADEIRLVAANTSPGRGEHHEK